MSDVAVQQSSPYGYEADIDIGAGDNVPLPVRIARRALFLRGAIGAYDVFHCNFGSTILQIKAADRVFDELALLKRLGKTIIVTYQGCDIRPFQDCPCTSARCRRDSPYRAKAALRFSRYADKTYFLNPDLRKFLGDAKFIPYASIDPFSIKVVRQQTRGQRDTLRVAHAPTDRDVKGTRFVLESVERLRNEGARVELDLIEHVSRTDVLRRLGNAHLVIDQLNLGWYGGLAVEAMSLGIPVVANINESLNPLGPSLPILNANPATVFSVLRDIYNQETVLPSAEVMRGFAEQTHDPVKIAATILRDIGQPCPHAYGLVSAEKARRGNAL